MVTPVEQMAPPAAALPRKGRYFQNFRHLNRDFAIAAALAALLTVGFGAWMVLRVAGADVSQVVDDVGEAVAALVAAIACAAAAWRHRGRMRLAWALLGVSALVWTAGEAAWSYFEIILKQEVPFPSPADAGFLAAVPFAVAGVAFFPGRQRDTTRLASLLDGAIIAGALLLISWATVLGSVYLAGSASTLSMLLGLAHPISDIVIAVMALWLLGLVASQVWVIYGNFRKRDRAAAPKWKRWDYFGLLPRFAFFSWVPHSHFELLYRDKAFWGEITPWNKIDLPARTALRRLVRRLVARGDLVQLRGGQRFGLPRPKTTVVGLLAGTSKGYAFVSPDDPQLQDEARGEIKALELWVLLIRLKRDLGPWSKDRNTPMPFVATTRTRSVAP